MHQSLDMILREYTVIYVARLHEVVLINISYSMSSW